MAGKPELTPMQWAFVDAYKGTGNGREAAEISGFKHPRAAAHRLLKDPRVRKAIAQRRAKVEEKLVEHVVRNTVMKSDIISGELRAIARLERLADAWEKSAAEDKAANKPFKIALAEHARVCAALSAAWDKLADLCGHKVSLSADLSKYFEGKSLEEQEFFCINGFFPDSLESAEPGEPGNPEAATSPSGKLKIQ